MSSLVTCQRERIGTAAVAAEENRAANMMLQSFSIMTGACSRKNPGFWLLPGYTAFPGAHSPFSSPSSSLNSSSLSKSPFKFSRLAGFLVVDIWHGLRAHPRPPCTGNVCSQSYSVSCTSNGQVKAVKRKKTKVQNKEIRPQNVYSFSSMGAKRQGPGEAQPILPPSSLGMLL